jgi:hypothetical protein
MSLKDTIEDDALAEQIVRYYGYAEEVYLTKTVAKLVINEYFHTICSGKFKNVSEDEIRECVVEELNRRFDEKVVPAVEQTYPNLSEDEIEAKLATIEKLYHKEHINQVEAVTKEALKELKNLVGKLQKDVAAIKKKYTT